MKTPRKHLRLGKLSLAIIEHCCGKVIGDKAIEELKLPAKEQARISNLIDIFAIAEERFLDECANPDIVSTVIQLPLHDLPIATQAINKFFRRPTDSSLAQVLRTQLAKDAPSLPPKIIAEAVALFIRIIREELAMGEEEFRSKATTLALLRIESQITSILSQRPLHPSPATKLKISFRSIHTIPPPPSPFIGREKELRSIMELIGAEGTAFIGISGPAGVGKTSLALKVAHDLAAEYLDGGLLLPLNFLGERGLSSEAALSRVIRSVSPELATVGSLEELRHLYLSLLSERLFILILDGLSDLDQIPLLMPPKDTLLIVTSRHDLSGISKLSSITLGPLSRSESIDLLTSIKPLPNRGSLALAKVLRGNPLGLVLSAKYLKGHDDVSAMELSREFVNISLSSDRVIAVASRALSSLDQIGQEVFRSLCVFRYSFDVQAAARILRIPNEHLLKIIDQLKASGLVNHDISCDRYSISEPIRNGYFLTLAPFNREILSIGHAAHYGAFLQDTESLFLQGGMNVTIALSKAQDEWPNIIQAWNWTIQRMHMNPASAKMCGGFLISAPYMLRILLPSEEMLQRAEAGLLAARLIGDQLSEGAHLDTIGSTHFLLGNPERAIDPLLQALRISRRIGNRSGEAASLDNLGSAFLILKNPWRALVLHNASLKIAIELGDRFHESRCMNNVAYSHLALGNLNLAEDCFTASIRLKKQLGGIEGLHRTYIGLSRLFSKKGDIRRAIQYAEEALDYAKMVSKLDAEEIQAEIDTLRATN
jgi:tetratricopeptide (TPR) repeat protein